MERDRSGHRRSFVSTKPAAVLIVAAHTSTRPPADMGSFEFARLSSLRAAQLMRGCTPRVPRAFKETRTAQREVAEGKVSGVPRTA